MADILDRIGNQLPEGFSVLRDADTGKIVIRRVTYKGSYLNAEALEEMGSWDLQAVVAAEVKRIRAMPDDPPERTSSECTSCERALLWENFAAWCPDCRSRWLRAHPGATVEG